jgi:hypothetical protein
MDCDQENTSPAAVGSCPVLIQLLTSRTPPISTAADNDVERDRVVLLIFESLNRRVWVLDASKTDVHAIEGVLPKPTVGKNGEAVYVLKKPLLIQIRETRIDFSETRILVNGQTMGSSLNAVVSKDGRVSIGAFLRDFD